MTQSFQGDSGRLRVLFVTPRAYPEMGGIETHVYEVARRLVGEVASITVLTTDRSGKQEPKSVVEGVNIIRVPAYPRTRDYYFAPALRNHITRDAYDIIHMQGFHTFVPTYAMWLANRAAIPYVNTFHSGGHSIGWRNMVRPLQAKLQRPLLARSRKLIGVSRFETEQFRRWLNLPASQFTVVQNGASLPPMPEGFQPPQTDTKTVLSVGRLEKYKGHHHLINAMPHVLAKCPEVRLKILGVGPYQEALQQQVREMNLTDKIEITHVPPSDRSGMTREMLSASLVTLFSEYEAHPVAVMEAAALKCSILVADTSGLSEIAEKGLAKAIPLNSTAEQLAETILWQLDHPHRAENVALPTWDSCTAQLLDIYHHVVNEVTGTSR